MQSQLQSPKFQSPSCLPCASLQPCRLLQHQHFTANLSSAQPQQPQHTLTQQNTSLKMIITALSEPAELRLPSTAGKSRAARRAPQSAAGVSHKGSLWCHRPGAVLGKGRNCWFKETPGKTLPTRSLTSECSINLKNCKSSKRTVVLYIRDIPFTFMHRNRWTATAPDL